MPPSAKGQWQIGRTHIIRVFQDRNDMAMILYSRGQFLGCPGSFSFSQSTSNSGSEVPVVPTEVTRWAVGGADDCETRGARVLLPGASTSSVVSWDEWVSAMETSSGTIACSCLCSEPFSGSREDMPTIRPWCMIKVRVGQQVGLTIANRIRLRSGKRIVHRWQFLRVGRRKSKYINELRLGLYT